MILEFDGSKKIQKIDLMKREKRKVFVWLGDLNQFLLNYFVEWFTSRDEDGKMLKVESSRE